jgi:hypothetical protein
VMERDSTVRAWVPAAIADWHSQVPLSKPLITEQR